MSKDQLGVRLEGRHERLRTLERNKDALLQYYTALAPEILDPGGASRSKDAKTHVTVLPDGGLKVSRAFGEETKVWETVGTSTK